MKLTRRQEWVVLGVLFLLLFALEAWVAHRYFTSIVLGANDFYSRWHGARALVLEGRNPYGLDVTAEIQPVINIDPQQVGRGGFNYPLHVIFFFWPLIYLPYAWTQAIWMVWLQWLAIGTVAGLLAWKQVKPSMSVLAVLILAMLALYPVTRTIFLGQFTLHITFCLVWMLVALNKGYDGLAGALLAATSIKPQMIIFVGPWLVLWAVGQKRWRFLAGLFGTGLAFLLVTLAWLPEWIVSFIEDTQRYTRFAGGKNPFVLLLEITGFPPVLFTLGVVLLVGAMLYSWWRGWRGSPLQAEYALYWTIAVTLVVTFQTGTTNLVMLVIPLFAWLVESQKRWGWKTAVFLLMLPVIGLWGLFLATRQGDTEHPLLFLPLPFLTLLILIGWEIKQRQTAVPAKTL